MPIIDVSTAAAARPAISPIGTPGFFSNGDPASSTAATIPGADWFNDLNGKEAALLTAASVILGKGPAGDNNWLDAIRAVAGDRARTVARPLLFFNSLQGYVPAKTANYYVSIPFTLTGPAWLLAVGVLVCSSVQPFDGTSSIANALLLNSAVLNVENTTLTSFTANAATIAAGAHTLQQRITTGNPAGAYTSVSQYLIGIVVPNNV